MTTIDNVTREQIERLLAEASEAGDSAQVTLCETALREWTRTLAQIESPRYSQAESQAALRACVRAIQSAEAME